MPLSNSLIPFPISVWDSPTLTYISSTTASNSANLSFTSLAASPYKGYRFYLVSYTPAASSQIEIQVSSNNGSSYISSGYVNMNFKVNATPAFIAPANVTTYIDINDGFTGTAALNGILDMYYQANSNNMVTFQSKSFVSGTAGFRVGISFYAVQANINAIQFIQSTGNITSGSVFQFGIT